MLESIVKVLLDHILVGDPGNLYSKLFWLSFVSLIVITVYIETIDRE